MPRFLKQENYSMNGEQAYTLITGASHGIGRAMAYECARLNRNLILVALADGELEKTVQDIQDKYPVDIKYYSTDLTIPENIKLLHQWYTEQNISLNFLINNAGMGTSGWFTDIDEKLMHTMLKLNNDATVTMCLYFIPELKKSLKSHLLNVGSMESVLPLPYKAVYTGTKQFNYGFTMAIREELKKDNISVSLLAPGAVPTHEEGLRRLEAQGAKGKLFAKMPEEVAEIAIRKTLKGKNVIIPGFFNRAIRRVSALIPPGLKLWLLEKIFRVYVKEGSDIN